MSTQDQAYDDTDEPLPNHQDESSSSSISTYYPTETDYYALLNLPRSPAPTESQIRSAYRTLALSFHPDKQPAQWHDAAGRHFAEIRAAYDTLVDPQKRAVYDLLGAEGVRAEWGPHGAMGMFGEARKQKGKKGEVGVRAMAPDEFRRWFLGVMKKRERVAVNRLVQCRSSLSLGIDAAGLIIVDEDDEVYVGIPTLQTNAFSVGCSFKTPLPTPRVIFGESEKENESDDESAEQEESPVETEMVINAGVKGQLRHLQREGTPLPLLMIANNITLGASINRTLDDLARPKGLFGERFSSVFTNAGCAANFLVLPAPILQTAYAKAYTPIPGTRPFTVQASALFKNSPLKCMPTLGLQITKPIAQRKSVFCSWSSGTLEWPYLFERLFGLGAYADNIAYEASSFQLGYSSLPKLSRSLATQDDEGGDVAEDDEEDLAFEMARNQLRAEDQAAESWQTVAMASPGGGGLSVTYSRNLFSGKAANEPRRSEWSGEGHYPLPQEVEPRSVRLEIQTSLALDYSLSWVVEGTRQVGEFTRMGLGVGLTDAQGLIMTFSWSRLGQKIQIPVKVCPLDSVTSDASTLALVVPWALYCAVEFGIIRPRDRRNRRRAIARRHRQLKKLIPKHRADSQQAIELMAEQTQRRQAREESQGGLVITKAEYGHYPSQKKKRDSEGTEPRPDEVADVTIPVAALVDRGQLVIAKDMIKFHILGFYDPAPLLSKSLKIWYLYHGKEHFVEVRDAEGVACPMRSHLI